MKKTVLAVIAMAAVAVPLTAMAGDDSFYLKGYAGIGMAMDSDIDNMPNHGGTAKASYDGGFAGALAAGYDFAGSLRTDVEYLWQKNDLNTLAYENQIGNFPEGDFKTQAFMFNGFLDAATGSAWTPYVGAGIGWAKLDLNTPAVGNSDYDDTFAYQFMGGVGYAMTDQLNLDFQYRFLGTGDASVNSADYSLTSNNLMLGLGYNF